MNGRRLIILGTLLFLPVQIFAYTSPGAPSGFVNDFAHALNNEDVLRLEAKISSFEKSSRNEISVVTIDSLGGDTIENFTSELFKEWDIGKKKTDTGVLILIAIQDRQMRIEVGYGLEGSLTDAQSIWIINNLMKPAFQKNDFYSGIDSAVDKIISATKGEIIPEESDVFRSDGMPGFLANSGEMTILVFVGFTWLVSILARSKSWYAGGIAGATIGGIIGFFFGFIYMGIVAIILLAMIGFLLDAAVSKNYSKNKALGKSPSWWAGGRGFGGSGGSSGFGGFSGGSSGGGGASGRW